MPGLTRTQQAVIRTLIDTAPDSVIRSLDAALSADQSVGAMAEIRDLVSAEAAERRARLLVFAPLVPLCPRQASAAERVAFPSRTIPLLWAALKAHEPAAVEAAMSKCRARDDDDPGPFDALCLASAIGLRDPEGSRFQAAAAALDAARPGGALQFASYLDLAALSRAALQHLPEWLGRMTDERACVARLAFKDAVDIAPDAGPRFFEIIYAHLDEPCRILRVISAVMDRPSDSYVCSSELAHLGERVLAHIDRQIELLAAFEPQRGESEGLTVGRAAHQAVIAISEFEQTLDLRRDGPWGQRVTKQRRVLAQTVEVRLRQADDALAACLPMKTVKIGGKMLRGMPKLGQEPNPQAIAKAEGLLAFLDQTRNSAAAGGYASARAKVVEKLEGRLDQYAEDLIELLRSPEGDDHQRARQFLEITARFIRYVRDEKAAQIVRRRAAA